VLPNLKRHKEEKYIFGEEGVKSFMLKNCWNRILVRNLLSVKTYQAVGKTLQETQ